MIEVNLGNVGSGKTASVVRDMVRNEDGKHTFSNIITKGVPNNTVISREMIMQKHTELSKANKEITVMKVNVDFWKQAVKKHKSINVVLDEAHTIFNARRGMTKFNVIMTDWLALLRRVLGGSDEGSGKLTLITQLDRRLDIIAREMATKIRYHICHYKKECEKCGAVHLENNESAEKVVRCHACGHRKLKVHSHVIEVYVFENVDKYEQWKLMDEKTYYDRYFITDIHEYFPYYDTLQWDNLLSEA